MMNQLIEVLIENKIPKERFLIVSSDETVFFSTKDEIEKEMLNIQEIINNKLPEFKDILKVEGFQLKSIKSKKLDGKLFGFVKEHVNSKKIEFKACSKVFFPQIYKHYMNLKPNEYDKKFKSDSFLATFDDYIF